jgi:hypothetical protein
LTHAFASSLEGLFRPEVKLWVFGHTHYAVDFQFRGTRVVSNPLGYGGRNDTPGYKKDKVLSVVTLEVDKIDQGISEIDT